MEDGFRWLIEGNYISAEEIYKKAISVYPDNVIALYELGWVYLSQYKYQEAEQTLVAALKLYPDNILILYEFAKVCILQKKYEHARQALIRLVKFCPKNIIFRYYLGRVYALLGKYEEAAEIFAIVKQMDNNIEVEMGNQLFDSFIELKSEDVEARQDITHVVGEDATITHVGEDATIVDPGAVALPEKNTLSRRTATSNSFQYIADTNEIEVNLEQAIFDDYIFKEKLLGQGGMGEVYLVRHLEWDKQVALKRCSRTENSAILDRFKRECLAWLTLEKHSNIVSAVHYTYWENKPSLLIEYIEGKTLKSIVSELRITAMVAKILNKLGTKPSLSKTMSLLTFFGGTEERFEIAQAWMIIIKEYSQLGLEEAIPLLQQAKIFKEHELGRLRNLWHTFPTVNECPKMTLPQIIDFAIQICWGMAHAHRHSLLHRDLKPANIIVENEHDGPGLIKITDFGLVKLKGVSETYPQVGIYKDTGEFTGLSNSTAIGTPRYMSLEQWESPDRVSQKSDIYSFGMILYELLTYGSSPFDSHIEEYSKVDDWWMHIAPQNELFYWSTRHCSHPPISLRQYSRNIPQVVENVVMQCLQKDANKRPESFQDLAHYFIDLYQQIAQIPYPRGQDISTEMMAIELNNRAVSLFEMGYPEKSQVFIERAIKNSPNVAEIHLNQALFEFLGKKISIAELVSRVLSNFGSSNKNLRISEVIIGIYLNYGVCFQETQNILQSNSNKNIVLQRFRGKCDFLKGNYSSAQEIFQFLCSLENSRLEDWYHFIASLYHQNKFQEIQRWMQLAASHFKYHISFREIQKLLNLPREQQQAPDNWKEVGIWESSYLQDKQIHFIQTTNNNENLVICFATENKNIIELYNIEEQKSKNCILPFPNKIEASHVASINDEMAFFSSDGSILIWNTQDGNSQKLATQLYNSIETQCLGGFIHSSDTYLISCHWIQKGTVKSLITVWNQSSWKEMRNFVLPEEIKYFAINSSENTCWFASESNLYTWRIGPEPPSSQQYGYQQQENGKMEYAKIYGVYSLNNNGLLILRQNYKNNQDNLEFYYWDLSGQKKHKSHAFSQFQLSICSISSDNKYLLLLGVEKDKTILFSWDIANWQILKIHNIASAQYQSIEMSMGNRYVFFNREEESLLDAFERNTGSNLVGIYSIPEFQAAEMFSAEGEIRYFATTSDNNYAFVVTEKQIVYIWKNVQQNPFPLYHKLNYLYTKPTSTVQDIGIQKQIQRLLEESDHAVRLRDPQKAMDYLRGIQNFKGYDWKQVMDRVYAIAQENSWQKMGIRESLKIRKITTDASVIISRDGKYLINNNTQKIVDVKSLDEVNIAKRLHDDFSGKSWVVSLDGRFLLLDNGQDLSIYDIVSLEIVGEFAHPNFKIQEAMANHQGSVMLLKEEGFGQIALLDLQTKSIGCNISTTKYHTLSDCCAILPDQEKILLANECQGGFTWTLIKKENNMSWKFKEYNLDFSKVQICKEPVEGGENSSLIVNPHYGIFRGINFDFLEDIQFKHIEIFQLDHELSIPLKDEKFRKNWLKSQAMATSKDGVYTFLGLPNGSISIWATATGISNWRQVMLLHEHQHPVQNLITTANSQFLISCDTSGVIKIIRIGIISDDKIWEEGDWEAIESLQIDGVPLSTQLSDDDRYLFVICEKSIHVWEFDWVWDIEQYHETKH